MGEGAFRDGNVPQGEWLQWLQEKGHFDGHASEFRRVLQRVIEAILNDKDPNNRILPYRVEYSQQVLEGLKDKILVVKVGKKNAGEEESISLINKYFKAQEDIVVEKREKMTEQENKAVQNRDFQGYLKATKQYAEVRKETIGKELLTALCNVLLEQVEELQDALTKWKKQLTTIGIKLGEMEEIHRTWRETKGKIPVRTYVTDERFEKTLYAKHRETAIENLLENIQWRNQSDGFVLKASFASHINLKTKPETVAEQAIGWAGTERGPFKSLGGKLEVNLATRIKERFANSHQSLSDQLVKDLHIAALIPLKNFPSNRLYHVLGLHQTVANDSEASQYYKKVYQNVASELKKHDYYRIGDGYIKDPENLRHTIAMEIAVGFKLEHRTDYKEYINTYLTDTDNFYALHCLPEEDTASISYEMEFKPTDNLYKLPLTPLLLEPTVVDILGDKKRLELFVEALAHNVIRRRDKKTRQTDTPHSLVRSSKK